MSWPARFCVAACVACLSVFSAMAQGQTNGANDTRRAGSQFMSPSLQAMQSDDAQNPAMLWIKDGEALWNRKVGAADKSCASCHGSAEVSMKGVAARYPALDPRSLRPINLTQRINQCRQVHQQAPALAPESTPLLGLEAFVALQSRGMPLVAASDARLAASLDRGAALYNQRLGQLNLSCAQCHDARAGLRLGGSLIPQAHPTGYPVYRLEWQALGSLQRRLRNCMSAMRAQPYPFGSEELLDLELFLASRANGMPLEAPGVRP